IVAAASAISIPTAASAIVASEMKNVVSRLLHIVRPPSIHTTRSFELP
ncbi:hypothetical protein SOVF_213700, partial [Spinacia oleracea]